MQPAEVWWLIDARRPRANYGSMSEHDVAELHSELVERGLLHG